MIRLILLMVAAAWVVCQMSCVFVSDPSSGGDCSGKKTNTKKYDSISVGQYEASQLLFSMNCGDALATATWTYSSPTQEELDGIWLSFVTFEVTGLCVSNGLMDTTTTDLVYLTTSAEFKGLHFKKLCGVGSELTWTAKVINKSKVKLRNVEIHVAAPPK